MNDVVIDQQLRTFLEQGVSMHLGTRTARLEPNGARVVALAVDQSGAVITVYVPDAQMPGVAADVTVNAPVAVACARPQDDRACQVKGEVVAVRPARPDEYDLVTRQWAALREQLEQVGIPREATRTWAVWPCTAIQFRVTAVFDQTPGPNAGARLTGGAA